MTKYSCPYRESERSGDGESSRRSDSARRRNGSDVRRRGANGKKLRSRRNFLIKTSKLR